jgi:hypothetical protein
VYFYILRSILNRKNLSSSLSVPILVTENNECEFSKMNNPPHPPPSGINSGSQDQPMDVAESGKDNSKVQCNGSMAGAAANSNGSNGSHGSNTFNNTQTTPKGPVAPLFQPKFIDFSDPNEKGKTGKMPAKSNKAQKEKTEKTKVLNDLLRDLSIIRNQTLGVNHDNIKSRYNTTAVGAYQTIYSDMRRCIERSRLEKDRTTAALPSYVEVATNSSVTNGSISPSFSGLSNAGNLQINLGTGGSGQVATDSNTGGASSTATSATTVTPSAAATATSATSSQAGLTADNPRSMSINIDPSTLSGLPLPPGVDEAQRDLVLNALSKLSTSELIKAIKPHAPEMPSRT